MTPEPMTPEAFEASLGEETRQLFRQLLGRMGQASADEKLALFEDFQVRLDQVEAAGGIDRLLLDELKKLRQQLPPSLDAEWCALYPRPMTLVQKSERAMAIREVFVVPEGGGPLYVGGVRCLNGPWEVFIESLCVGDHRLDAGGFDPAIWSGSWPMVPNRIGWVSQERPLVVHFRSHHMFSDLPFLNLTFFGRRPGPGEEVPTFPAYPSRPE